MSYSQQHVVAEGENPASSSYFNAEMTYMYNGMNTIAAGLAAHLADEADAHDASAISVLDTGDLLTATTVEAALAEVQGNLTTHIDDTSDAHAASAISVLDTGDLLTATTVEAALAELHGDVTTLEGTLGDLAVKDTVAESDLALTDVTTANVSTSAHGFVPKAPNNAGQFLSGLGTWAAVSNTTWGYGATDATEYTKTGDTDYTLKKTFTFTPGLAVLARIDVSAQIKNASAVASSGAAGVKFVLDDTTTLYEVEGADSDITYVTKSSYSSFISLAASEHTIKVYLKVTKSTETGYMQNTKVSITGVQDNS